MWLNHINWFVGRLGMNDCGFVDSSIISSNSFWPYMSYSRLMDVRL